jgi:hypothetical protein
MEEMVPLFATTAVAESIHSAAVATALGVGFDVDGFNFVICAVEKVLAISTSASAATPDSGGKVTPATAAPSVGAAEHQHGGSHHQHGGSKHGGSHDAHQNTYMAAQTGKAGAMPKMAKGKSSAPQRNKRAHKDTDLESPGSHTVLQAMVGLATFVGVVAVAKRMRDQSRHSEWREVGQPGETEPIMQARLPKLTYQ